MRILIVFICISLLLLFFVSSVQKPKYQKEDFKVWVKCDMYKMLIEKTVKLIEGIKTARWNIVNGKMKVKLNPEKKDLEKTHKNIAVVGYDTELFKATDESYNYLYHCCKYEQPTEKK